MKTSNRNQRMEQMIAHLIVLLVLAVLIALLPGRTDANPASRARPEPVSVVVDSDIVGCRTPVRAPTSVTAQDRRPEGRIDRIPPRPRSDRDVWVPGRSLEKAEMRIFRGSAMMRMILVRV